MNLADEIRVLRGAVGVTRLEHVAGARVSGDKALAVLSRLSTRRLFLREGQMAHTLFLREDALPLADAYIASGEDGAYYVLAEGPTEGELVALLERTAAEVGARDDVTSEGLSRRFALVGLNGPYAWELVARVVGSAALGMPYLTILHFEEGICCRAGKTGEYGYDLLIERVALADFDARLSAAGGAVGLERVGLPALDQCALENWHFNVRTLRDSALASPLTPLELQLQWRLSRSANFVGKEAVEARRARGIAVRSTCFTASAAVRAGEPIRLADARVGEVLSADYSPTLDAWVGIGLISTPIAHPGIRVFRAGSGAEVVSLATRTPPLINNRSLYVDPHRHSFATREVDRFPALAVRP